MCNVYSCEKKRDSRKRERIKMIEMLNMLVELAQKEKDIVAPMSSLTFIEKLNSEPDVFHEIFPLLIVKGESLFEHSLKEGELFIS